jgi:hypothetical protein
MHARCTAYLKSRIFSGGIRLEIIFSLCGPLRQTTHIETVEETIEIPNKKLSFRGIIIPKVGQCIGNRLAQNLRIEEAGGTLQSSLVCTYVGMGEWGVLGVRPLPPIIGVS